MAAGSDRLDVYLVRHAYAAHADPARWPDDALRPVTDEGAERFREAARGLAWLVPDIDLLLSSGYARAWQTAELLHEIAGWPVPEECPALEPGRPPSEAVDALRGRTDARDRTRRARAAPLPAPVASSAPGARTGWSCS